MTKLTDITPPPKTEVYNEEIVEVVEVVEKVKKPKRIVKKVIKQEYDSDTTEEQEIQVIEPPIIPPKYKPKTKKDPTEKTTLIENIATTLFNY